MSYKEALLELMQYTNHEMAIGSVLNSTFLSDDQTSLFLNGVVERSIHRVYEVSECCPVWRSWADLWLTNKDRSSETAAAIAETVQADLDRGCGWGTAEDTYGAIDAANCAAAASMALAAPVGPLKFKYSVMALVAGCKSSADAIADDVGKTKEVEQQYSELLAIIQEMQS